jgi:CubicO group peptidase (beta-lactamase class C family)
MPIQTNLSGVLMKRLAKMAAAFALTCATGLVVAQVPPAPQPVAPAQAPAAAVVPGSTDTSSHPLTAEDLSTFFDGLVPFALDRGDVAGGVISVVKDGQVIFARGYGYADLKTRKPVSADSTLFRIGSTSKLFTWTAVMQQVEQGKLDLDKDVNTYLDFTIPPFEGKPITLRNVMTHTPGFEDVARGLIADNEKNVNLEKYLKSHLPERIFAPGTVVAYSNYACGLAGYIVQRVSGQEFNAYVQQHILAPLDMQRTTFDQPLPASLLPMMAVGYQTASDGKPKGFEFVDPAAAGSVSTTAIDMTHFMIAHLQNGRFNDTRILQEATAEKMHTPQRTEAPGLNGFALGFYQEDRNGQRIIGHAGDLNYFHSDLHLMLDANVGVFMSFNSAGNEGGAHVIRGAVFDAFLDRYFPLHASTQPTASSAEADAARVSGWYLASRKNDSSIRMLYALTQTSVSALPDHSIMVSAIKNAAGTPVHWREIGPLRYQEENGPHHLDFVADAQGGIQYWATDAEPPVFIFQRVASGKTLGALKLWIPLALVFALATLLSWLFGWLVRRHYARRLELTDAQRRTRLWSRLGTLVLFAAFAGWLILLIAASADQSLLLGGTATPWMYVLFVLGIAALLGVLAIVFHTVGCWRSPRRGRWVLLGETLLALVAIYLAWIIVAFGMISFNVRF